MSKFIYLTRNDGSPIAVNVENVVTFRPANGGMSTRFDFIEAGDHLVVKEKYEDIKANIERS